MREVFDRLSKARLAINLLKSEFFASELEFLDFLQVVLPNVALLLQLLTSLMKKSAVWKKSQQDAFQRAKQALVNSLNLQHPSPTAQVQLNTDASGTHVGAALMQREIEQKPWFPVAFYSK